MRASLGPWVPSPNQHWQHYHDNKTDTLLEFRDGRCIHSRLRLVQHKNSRKSHTFELLGTSPPEKNGCGTYLIPADTVLYNTYMEAFFSTGTIARSGSPSHGVQGKKDYVKALTPDVGY